MALDAVVFPQDPLSYGYKESYLYSLIGGGSGSGASNGHDYGFQAPEDKENKVNCNSLIELVNNNVIEQSINANWDSVSSSPPSVLQNDVKDQWDSHSYSPESVTRGGASFNLPPSSSVEATVTDGAGTRGRRKRRRTKSVKNKEEIESQRMTHIAVERNRRKQMNEYLAVLRSLMPPSYVQRGDQASIIGGAINFLKELEQHLQSIKAQKKTNHHHQQQQPVDQDENNHDDLTPFANFFTFPQYSKLTTLTHYPSMASEVMMMMTTMQQQNKSSLAVADIEVSLVDSHANMKILLKKKQGMVVKMVVGLQSLGFTILHLNVTTSDDMVLTSVCVKVEERCQMNTVDEIATAVNQLLGTIHEEAATTAD